LQYTLNKGIKQVQFTALGLT